MASNKFRKSNVNKFSKGLRLNSTQEQTIRILSTQLARASLSARMGKTYDDNRDIYEALGYSKNLSFSDYWGVYKRQDIARRIVNAPVQASWMRKPIVTENLPGDQTEFEKAWQDLVKKKRIYHYMARADRISGIGMYGVLFLGLDDGKKPVKEVKGKNELIYLQPYKEDNAAVQSYVKDVMNERFGLPEFYKFQHSVVTGDAITSMSQGMKTHHSRAIHIAEGADESDIFGSPRLEEVFNRLIDLERVAGGSAEMFWRGAFPGLVFKADDDATFSVDGQAKTALEDEIESYIHGLKRYMRVKGLSVEDLASQVSDPKNHVDILLELIAGAKAIPKRILTGSERGELASSQDEANWHTQIEIRRTDYVEPVILRPTIDKFIEYGVLPKPKDEYYIEWPDLFSPSAKDKAELASRLMESLSKYVSQPDAQFIFPIEEFYELVFEWDEKKIETVVGRIDKRQDDENGMVIEELQSENEELREEIEMIKRNGTFQQVGEN